MYLLHIITRRILFVLKLIIIGGIKLKYNLKEIGLNENIIDEYNNNFSEFYLGRVATQHKNYYTVLTEKEEVISKISGKMEYDIDSMREYPAVGDWVVLDRDTNETGDAIIHHIFSRKSILSRKVAGKKNDEQIVATNIDIIFICMALTKDYNIRRLERYISLAWDSGATPVVILTKTDLCDDVYDKVLEVQQVAIGIDVLAISSITDEGIEEVKSYIKPNCTIAFIGSSGIGKSTLINKLLGEVKQKINDVRNDEKGRHTTTRRELIVLPLEGIVIDTPGMRELQLYSGDLDTSFSDIEELAIKCHFSDCKHETEPKCAVKQAIEDGVITEERLKSYNKLKKELEYQEDKLSLNAKQIEKKKIINMVGSLDGMKKAKKR